MKFVVGESYYPYDRSFSPITVLKRTAKTIFVTNGDSEWRMRIKTDRNGNEYATDSSVPADWQDVFTYTAEEIVK